jgi:nucleoside 2-deoxyribosyltransferase
MVIDYGRNIDSEEAVENAVEFKQESMLQSACDACVLVLPCGRSTHTEAGWFAGQGKKVYAYIPNKDSFEPELMYKLFTKVCISLDELIESI